jgi:hypothetical protein
LRRSLMGFLLGALEVCGLFSLRIKRFPRKVREGVAGPVCSGAVGLPQLVLWDSTAMNRDTGATCGRLEDDVLSSPLSSGNPIQLPPVSKSQTSHGRAWRLTSAFLRRKGFVSQFVNFGSNGGER